MDINNNQQINTFTKGMDTDTSDMYIGEGSYRYAENLRVVTDKDGNTGELHLIEGTNIVSEVHGPGVQLLGFTSIRNYIIEIVKRGSTWAICRRTVEKDEQTEEYKVGEREVVAGPFTKPIWPTKEEEVDGETIVVDDWDGKTKPLSLVTRWEADDNIKLYIANGYTEVLSINIAPGYEQVGRQFDDVFQVIKITLPPIQATVTKRTGARIPGVVLQYAYVIYEVRGQSSTMSSLSNIVSVPKNNTHGFEADQNTTRVVELSVPSIAVGKYIRVYRVAYSKSGQLPRVDIIYDQLCQSSTLQDSGQSLLNVATAEFIATNKLLFVPKEIESKGDYLFAGNIKYTQDEIDKTFENFDARCFSYGNYYKENGNDVWIRNNADDSTLLSIKNKNIDLHHSQFDNPRNIDYAQDGWQANQDGYNGKGLCFSWKYVYTQGKLFYEKQYDSEETPRTYARNEVYRFGVRLFDEKGNASSVKWIADIKMPDYFDNNGYVSIDQNAENQEQYLYTNNISIKFVPRNTDKEYWKGVSKYEIVQAKRSIEDSYKVTQGISGYPMDLGDNELCLPYFLTANKFNIHRGMRQVIPVVTEDGQELWTKDYSQYKGALLYASPEYAYQHDDMDSIFDQNDELVYKETAFFTRGAKRETPAPGIVVLKYNSDYPTELNTEGTDLRIQIDTQFDETNPYYYRLSQSIMTDVSNGQSETPIEVNQNSQTRYGPIGGSGRGGRKNVYFTNMYAQKLLLGTKKSATVTNVSYVQPEDMQNFAKNEWPTYRSQFKTLHNGKKFFNWTNPALIDKNTYEYFTQGGEDRMQESWKETTMTSQDADKITWKYTAQVRTGADYDSVNGIVGSSALTFPTSVGGPCAILEFDNEMPIIGSGVSGNNMPAITVANICKYAVPYGGYTVSAINNTQYVSGGYFGSPTDGGIDVKMGDNFITMFVYFLYHSIDNAQNNDVPTAALQYIVPIESTIDLSKQCSNYLQATNSNDNLKVGNGGSGVWVQAKPSTVAGRFTQTTDMYMYNTAYSVLPDIVTYAGQDTVNAADSLYDSRIHYSQKKQNNELIDSWTSFKAIDYLDVDSRYGQVTGLKLFKDKLIFLQENGAGVLSVNDRIILKDQESANIIVGNGGILDRYDYFTTIYGMKPDQHVVEATNDALYWWDGHRREILGYTDGYNIALLQRIKNVQNYINNGTESDTPSIICDANNKEVLFNVVNNESLVYNEQIQQFTSVYTFNPIYYCNIYGDIYLTEPWFNWSRLCKYNVDNTDGEGPKLGLNLIKPKLKYIVNKDPVYNKVFDVQTFGGRFYGGDGEDLVNLNFDYKTPLKQHSSAEHGEGITNREYDYRLAIPRNNDDLYGGRMRGKTMECEITSDSNNKDFSIQYVTTKYRMSWS